MLPDFGQGLYEFKRRKSRRMPIRKELQVVPDPLTDEGSLFQDMLGYRMVDEGDTGQKS